GGLQKEAYFFEKQCITLRDETEWVELIECGVNILVGADKDKILETYKSNGVFNIENSKLDLYGGGKASWNIIKELINYKVGK
ncbi:MAG: UDP-N-acetylglucosamine 2-epimerase, partial [Campylobacterota bacterium]|nr:UDP-N-acetylglucosamine 2-epimerase [Campylobacterota bacterium]